MSIIVLGRCLHVHHDYEYALGICGLEPTRLLLGVLHFQQFEVGADSFVKIKLPLQYLNEYVKDACCGWPVCSHDHLGDDLG